MKKVYKKVDDVSQLKVGDEVKFGALDNTDTVRKVVAFFEDRAVVVSKDKTNHIWACALNTELYLVTQQYTLLDIKQWDIFGCDGSTYMALTTCRIDKGGASYIAVVSVRSDTLAEVSIPYILWKDSDTVVNLLKCKEQ